MPNFIRTARVGVLVPILAALAACGAGDAAEAQNPSAQVREQLGPVPSTVDTVSAARLSGAFRGASARALPAVVQVRVISEREQRPLAQNPFRDFMPEMDPDPRAQGTGSGVIFDPRGYILTNNHVIAGATEARVKLVDGREYEATVVGTDPDTDVGVIQIQPRANEKLPVVEIGSSDEVKVGDWVIALGNPLGLDFTVTAGIVSAKDRAPQIIRRSQTALESFIQTDAAINPGNSGGPLVDLRGRVVGINTAIQSPTGYYSGAGFAIPIDLAKKVADDLIKYGAVHRPRLGVTVSPVSEADAEYYRLPAVAGAEISSVQTDGAASQAGLRMGDVVVALDGEPVRTQAEFMVKLAEKQPGDRVRITYFRGGQQRDATVQLGQFEATAARPRAERPARQSPQELLGFSVEPANARAVTNCRVTGNTAGRMLVTEVERFSGASEAGVGACMELISINGQEIHSAQDVQRVASRLKQGDVVSLVWRDPSQRDAVPTIVNYRAH